jgi:heme oxygenase (biliverdin-IX-beta and delta-forming)
LDIQRLRQQTAVDHQAVEGSVPLMHHDLSQEEYVRCLERIHGIVAAWEERSMQVAPEWLKPALAARRRKRLVEADLAWFGATQHDESRPALPEMNDLPALLGAMYVMEGSTLGGQFIARHVETELRLGDGQGSAYFRGHGNQTGTLWKDFCEVLKSQIPDEQTEAVILSAKAMFSTFGMWMQRKSATDAS